jgi:hypothetical protein
MCSPACLAFGQEHLTEAEICGKTILEVGALNVNGSLRSWVEARGPQLYVGVDIVAGPGVDEICDAERLVARFGADRFHLVICTEMLEHVQHWRRVVSNLKNVLSPRGVLLMTTRSVPFGYHGYPYDFWRYSEGDCRQIFSDMTLDALVPDPEAPGILLKATKSERFVERGLEDIRLYSILKSRRCRDISDVEVLLLSAYWKARPRILGRIPQAVLGMLKAVLAHRRRRAARDA